MRRIAVLQSNFLPWFGMFDLLNYVDEFVVLDGVQFTKNDWRNRNVITVNKKPFWLTVPVKHKFGQSISEVLIDDSRNWRSKLVRTLQQSFGKSPYFEEVMPSLENILLDRSIIYLGQLNLLLYKSIAQYLEIDTKIEVINESESEEKSERLISICHKRDAGIYVSGPAAQCYIDVDRFQQAGISIEWFVYQKYPRPLAAEGSNRYNPSCIELMFNIEKCSLQNHLRERKNA